MRRVAKKPRPTGAKKPPKVSAAKLRELRATAKTIREQVAHDRDQIAAEARTVVADAVASGRLTKLTLLLRPDEQPLLDALDHYAAEHGLKSRNQVLRAALAHLLNLEIDQPHCGWPPGKPR